MRQVVMFKVQPVTYLAKIRGLVNSDHCSSMDHICLFVSVCSLFGHKLDVSMDIKRTDEQSDSVNVSQRIGGAKILEQLRCLVYTLPCLSDLMIQDT